ncbi:glycosyltransferase [Hymenobacter fodinae]|uniref:Glycosyltransferase n=1 Tax=Hymenobacter fodinae TaxID=2510796 RepID=A0A4Z0P4K3_9BACT|nr:cellulose synthase catalytic subunit [Hymenobacter fodinae]TGE06350.1 glycosyltransferase [Hymenobacter fodinae]
MRHLVGLGLVSLVYFVVWFATSKPIGYAPLFWLLTFSLGFKILRMLHEWYHYVNVTEPLPPVAQVPQFTVDILTTFCPGEPHAMVVQTLEAMQAVTYPHTSYLCDEGNDPYLRAVCERLGVVHVTREIKVNAKAGNINHALEQATGDLCVVLDPDHVPTPDFLDHVVPYFADASVGYVQVVQAYGNQQESLVARGAAEQTYHFYGPLMMGMNSYNTAQAIGANCTFRRAALDSIGGHAAGLTEDMHTAMRLHAAGWQSVYVPRILSRGLVPSTLGAFYSQQLKWARGAFELLFEVYPRLFTQFSWRQRLHYAILPLYFLSGLITLIDLAVPIYSLAFSVYPWHISLPAFVLHLTPLLGIGLLIRYKAQSWLRDPSERGLHLAGGILRVGTWWVYLLGLVYTFLRVRVPYIPTPKEGNYRNEFRICLPNILVIVACAVAVKYAGYVDWSPYSRLMAFLATCNAGILMAAVVMGQHVWARNLMQDMGSEFMIAILSPMVRVVRTMNARIQSVAAFVAAGSVALVAFTDVAMHVHAESIYPEVYTWLLNGGDKLRVGTQFTTLPEKLPVQFTAGSDSKLLAYVSSEEAPDVAALNVTKEVPTATIMALQKQGTAPLLTWQAGTSAASWRAMAVALQHIDKPVLLRPLIQASSPEAYRISWQAITQEFKAAKATKVLWVWTPPTTASVQAYFPGKALVNWVAVPCSVEAGSAKDAGTAYETYRHQFATSMALHDKPIMLLLQDVVPENKQVVQRVAQRYPEVKAILFPAPTREDMAPLLTNTKKSLLLSAFTK